jgi:hypothetical protein
LKEENSEIIARKYIIRVKKQRITSEQKKRISRILDNILPKQSERNYRYKKITDKNFMTSIKKKLLMEIQYQKYFYLFNSSKKKDKTFKV